MRIPNSAQTRQTSVGLLQVLNTLNLLASWKRILREFVVGCLLAVLAGVVLGGGLVGAIVTLIALHH